MAAYRAALRIDDCLNRYLEQMNEADADDTGGSVDAKADLQEKIASIIWALSRVLYRIGTKYEHVDRSAGLQ